MTVRGAFLIAVLVEVLVLLAGWYLRIRGIKGFQVIGIVIPLLAFHSWVYWRFFRAPPEQRRPLPRDPVIVVLALASIFITPLGGFLETGDVPRLVRFAAFVSLVVIAEEVFYRGILQAAMERVMHPLAAIALANVAFIAAHAPVMEMNALSISIGAAAGMVFGVMYYATRSLVWPVFVHLLNDWVLVLPFPTLLSNEVVVVANVVTVVVAVAWWWRRQIPLGTRLRGYDKGGAGTAPID